MAIFNLTKEKYSSIITKEFKETVYRCMDVKSLHRLIHGLWRLEEVPVYLVESTQSQSTVSIPRCQYAIKIPKDKWEEMSEVTPQKSLNDLLHLRDLQEYWEMEKKPEPKKGVWRVSVVDRLGVYVSDKDPIIAQRIFVWVDKICQCANGDVENASALLMQVILHELTHAFMDVSLFSKNRHNTLFTYNHPAYKFIEEALANGLSLHMCMPFLTTSQQLFLEQFVLNQGLGYSEGIPIFKSYPMHYLTCVSEDWRWAKSFFNKEIAGVICKSLFNVTPNSGSWVRPLGSGLRDVHMNIIRAQRSNTVNTTNTSKV